jgi:hypothetical protein
MSLRPEHPGSGNTSHRAATTGENNDPGRHRRFGQPRVLLVTEIGGQATDRHAVRSRPALRSDLVSSWVGVPSRRGCLRSEPFLPHHVDVRLVLARVP